jgi:hypothetical protein
MADTIGQYSAPNYGALMGGLALVLAVPFILGAAVVWLARR